jgi:ribosomal protein S12 methylthiotransferase accessory factor
MKITFPGGKKVNAVYKDFIITTDQSKKEGGEGTSPEPFSLFLASIGTCTGIYILDFCQHRNIPTDKLGMELSFEKNNETHLIEKINIILFLPKNFPKSYEKAILKTASLCTVKRHLDNPPKINITLNQQN